MVFSRLIEPARYVPALWDLRRDAEARAHWVQVFELQFDDMLRILAERRGEPHRQAALPVREKIFAFLARLDDADLAARPHVHAWTELRDELLRQHGVDDPYREVKDEENERALGLLPDVLASLRDAPDLPIRLRRAMAGIFAGNIFDLGSPHAAREHQLRGARFSELREEVLERPWLRDDCSRLAAFLGSRPSLRHTVILVDNAGPDFLCGTLPFGLLLAEAGSEVVLAANEGPTLNDVTCAEAAVLLDQAARIDSGLAEQLRSHRLRLISTGTRTPGIDFREISAAFETEAADTELLVLEGQGRALETNWDTRLSVHALRVSTIKDSLVARLLGGSVYDLICDFREPGAAAPSSARASLG